MKISHGLLFLVLALMFSCSDNPHLKKETEETTQSSASGDGDDDSSLQPVVCGSGVPGTGSTCSGTTADGDNCGQIPISNYHIRLAGLQDWYPQKSRSLMYPQKAETELRFKSDGRLRVRVKVNPQPEPFNGIDSNGNQMHACEGRVSGADTPGAYRYQKISMDIRFFTSRLESGKWVKDQLLQVNHLKAIEVNGCSPIVELPAEKIKISENPILVEVYKVSSDLFCHVQGIYCPSERIMRPQDCYDITLQVVNDISDDFR